MIPFNRHSLQTRVALFTLTIFLLAIGSIGLYGNWILRDEMQRQLGDLQFASTAALAASLNDELQLRVRLLERFALDIDHAHLHAPAALQQDLETRMAGHREFNGGVFITDADGIAIADVPREMGRIGIRFRERASVGRVLAEGKSVIGPPTRAKTHDAPVFGIVAPIRDNQGRVLGTIAGTINLAQPNFLDRITEARYGQGGGYLLLDPQHSTIVTATHKERVLQAFPSQGANPLFDHFRDGSEGYGVLTDAQGSAALGAAKLVPAAGWILLSAFPTREAFQPIEQVQRRLGLAAITLSLLAGALTWWALTAMLRRQFAPTVAAVQRLDALAECVALPIPLPVARADEIGELIASVNRLLAVLAQREAALADANERYRTTFMASRDAININRLDDGMYLDINAGFTRLTGWHRDDIVGRTSGDIHIWRNADDRRRLADRLARDGSCENLEAEFVTQDGHVKTGLMSAHLIRLQSQPCVLSVTRDISERKAAEAEFRKLSLAVEQSSEAIVITNLAAEIEYVNPSFERTTGYTREEVMGRNPRILQSSQTSRETYTAMWAALTAGQTWKGPLWNRTKTGQDYIEFAIITPLRHADGQITHYVAIKEDITAKQQAQERIDYLELYDALTELPNRQLLLDRMRRALSSAVRRGRELALLVVNLDDFKTLNESMGHALGDRLLQQVAQTLLATVRRGDTVARVGGDEFVVMLEDLRDTLFDAAAQAETVCGKLLAALDQPFRLHDYVYHASACIGITLLTDGAATVDDMLKRADLALHHAKAEGRNAYRFFDAAMQTAVTQRVALERNLREALHQEEFVLYFQPQVDGAGCVIGAEALLRWRDPRRGLIAPAEFIPVAEDTGLIVPLGYWVLERACRQLLGWAQQPALAHLTLAVNVSPRQFRQWDFVEQVRAVIARTGVDPARLKLELTERIFVDNMEDVIAKMEALKAMGIGLSLDDFGTGYSCLAYLKRLPLDQLKIDQSFVRDVLQYPNDAAIAKMIITLADSLGLAVIAEGVETPAQRDALCAYGCDTYQGYLMSRPLPLDEFETFLAVRAQHA